MITRPRCAATTSAHRDSNSSTRSPIRSSVSRFESAVKLHDVGEADRERDGVEVLLVRAEGLDAGDGGGEVPLPDVDVGAPRTAAGISSISRSADSRSGCRWWRRFAGPSQQLLDPVHQRRDLPVREPRHRLADRAGEVDGQVEVDEAGVDEADQRRERLGVGPGERGLVAVLGEPERPPQPPGLVEVDTGLVSELYGGEDARLAEDRRSRSSRAGPVGRSDTFVAGSVGVELGSSSLSLRWVSSTFGMSCNATWPCVLASLMTSVPQPSIRSMVLLVGESLIRTSGMSWPRRVITP